MIINLIVAFLSNSMSLYQLQIMRKPVHISTAYVLIMVYLYWRVGHRALAAKLFRFSHPLHAVMIVIRERKGHLQPCVLSGHFPPLRSIVNIGLSWFFRTFSLMRGQRGWLVMVLQSRYLLSLKNILKTFLFILLIVFFQYPYRASKVLNRCVIRIYRLLIQML